MGTLVSVVIPTFNRAAYLPQAVQSALEQQVAGGSVEVVVVDDGSTDDTAAVMRRFGPPVRYLRQANRREGAARNTGAGVASGAYLAFLDSDDYYLPGKLAGDVARLERADRPALVYSRARNVDPADRPLGARRLPTPEGDVFWALVRDSFVPLSTVTVRAHAFRALGGFVEDPALSGTADWELWVRLAARRPFGFADQTSTCIRVHPRSMLADPSWMERAMLAGLDHALADPEVVRRVGRRQAWLRSNMYVSIALNACANGQRTRAWRWLGRAVAAWPPELASARFLQTLGRVALGHGGVRLARDVLSPATERRGE